MQEFSSFRFVIFDILSWQVCYCDMWNIVIAAVFNGISQNAAAPFWFVKSFPLVLSGLVHFWYKFYLCPYFLPFIMCIFWFLRQHAVAQDGMGLVFLTRSRDLLVCSCLITLISSTCAYLVPLICFTLRCREKQPSAPLCRQLLLWWVTFPARQMTVNLSIIKSSIPE